MNPLHKYDRCTRAIDRDELRKTTFGCDFEITPEQRKQIQELVKKDVELEAVNGRIEALQAELDALLKRVNRR